MILPLLVDHREHDETHDLLGVLPEGVDLVSVDLAAIGASLADFQVRLETEALPEPFADEDGDGTYTATFLFLSLDASYEVSVPEFQDGVTEFLLCDIL